MAFVHGKDTYFKVASTDLSTYINSVSVSRTADTAETSAFGSSTKSFVSGLRDATITVSGMFDAAVYSTLGGGCNANHVYFR
jgi:hypothetical protein